MTDPAVERLEVAAYRVATDLPEADGTLSWDATTAVVVHAHGGGQVGMGWTYASGSAGSVVSELLADEVVGHPVLDVTAANDRMSKAVRNVGRQGIAATAISAVDVALWDLKARLLELPLHRLLGAVRTDVPIYGSGGFTTYDDAQTSAQVRHWVDQLSLPAVKIKIGESWGSQVSRDLHRVELVRGLVGDRQVFVDANGGYTVGQAVRVGQELERLGVTWFEEPVSSDDLAGLRSIRAGLSLDVAAGEYGWDLPYFERMLAAEAVDCLQIDATRCGGITEFLRAAAVAASRNFEISAHCAPHLHAAFASSVPNLRHVEYFHDHVRIEERLLFDGALPPTDGVLRPNDVPGHGITLRADAEKWRVS